MKREGKKKSKLNCLIKLGNVKKIFVCAVDVWEERVKAETRKASSGNPLKSTNKNVIPRCEEHPKGQSPSLSGTAYARMRVSWMVAGDSADSDLVHRIEKVGYM